MQGSVSMKNYLLGAAVFVLAFALSLGFADNKSDQSKQARNEKSSKRCCMDKQASGNVEDCADEVQGTSQEAGLKAENVSEKSSCSDMWDKMASKDAKMDCCKGEKAGKLRTTKSTKKAG